MPFRKVEDTLVCSNGHTISNTLAERDEQEFGPVGKRKRIHRQKKEKQQKRACSNEDAFRVFYALWIHAKEFFRTKDERLFLLWTEQFRINEWTGMRVQRILKEIIIGKTQELGDEYALYKEAYDKIRKLKPETLKCDLGHTSTETVVDEVEVESPTKTIDRDPNASFCDFYTTVYLSVRREAEVSGGIYTFSEHGRRFSQFDYDKHLDEISTNYKDKFACSFSKDIDSFAAVDCKLRCYSQPGYDSTDESKRGMNSTGCITMENEMLKYKYRTLFVMDTDMALKYLHILFIEYNMDKIGINRIRFLKYFKKWLGVFGADRLYLPEVDYSLYILTYVVQFHPEYTDQYLSKISNYTNLTRNNIVGRINQNKKLLNRSCSPGFPQKTSRIFTRFNSARSLLRGIFYRNSRSKNE
ncbi:hypothetical protein ECANGB1_1071 [Enterospora canceri]|uniref:Uncharacterized protein n=1 Tax=Enterospora canceri TaxID=1081671 RepID=A0A1Y1S6X7_9MICR|nr:hypothetical protein ECANGB1_1071 [Enterospora canceri]